MEKQKSAEMRDIIHAVGYLLASTSSRADLGNSCKLQSVALAYVLNNQNFSDANNLLLFPFFEAFWRKAITEQRFAFAYPRIAQTGFDEKIRLALIKHWVFSMRYVAAYRLPCLPT
jgi:hypothetical protein